MALRSIVIAAGLVAASVIQVQAASVVQGKHNAIEACSACHQVQPKQPPPAPVRDNNYDMDVPAPSFMEIAAKHGTDVGYLRKHITEPEWPMREQDLDEGYLLDIIAYINSLKPKAKHHK